VSIGFDKNQNSPNTIKPDEMSYILKNKIYPFVMAGVLSSLKINSKRDNDTELKRKYVMQLSIYKVLLLLSGLLLAPQVPVRLKLLSWILLRL
jgi:hypothetical protein